MCMIINDWNLKEVDSLFLNKIKSEYNSEFRVFPKYEDLFKVYKLIKPENVKVVIIGQDPYPTYGDADGLAFSSRNKKSPKSLENLFKELKNDLGIERTNNNLEDLALQGVFLLNTTLMVREGIPNYYQNFGFDKLLLETIGILNYQENFSIIFLLMGKSAQKIRKYISPKHLILETVHPSPLSAYRGFFGSKIFSRINFYLKKQGLKEIDWS